MKIYKDLAGQTFVYGLGSIIPRFFNYLLVPLYTNLFAPGEYGIITELYAYVTFLIIILTYGMETGFFRFSTGNEKHENVLNVSFYCLLITSSVFIILTLLLRKNIATAIGYENNPRYILWFGLILGIDAICAIPFANLRIKNKALKFATVKIINVIINISGNMIFFILLPKLINFKLNIEFIFISNLIATLCTFLILIPGIIKIKFDFSLNILKELLIYSLPLLIAGLAGSINEALDRVLLKHLIVSESNTPLYEVGIYGANFKLAIIMVLFIQEYRYAAEPFFFNMEKEKNSKTIYSNLMKYFIIFCLSIFLLVTFYLDIFKYFIGKNYWEGLKVVPILLLGYIFYGIFFNLSVWYKLTNKTYFGALITITGALITFLLNYLYIPKYGYLASAWAHVICYFVMVIMSFILMRKFFKIKYDFKNIAFYFVIAGLLYLGNKYIYGNEIKLKYIINGIALLAFIVIAFIMEKKIKKYES